MNAKKTLGLGSQQTYTLEVKNENIKKNQVFVEKIQITLLKSEAYTSA